MSIHTQGKPCSDSGRVLALNDPPGRFGRRMSGYMAMRGMPELLKWYSSTLKKTQDCRGDGEAPE